LTAKQVKYILMESGVAITTDVIVGGKAGDVRSQHYPNLVKL
jgi:intergrase/recombinase